VEHATAPRARRKTLNERMAGCQIRENRQGHNPLKTGPAAVDILLKRARLRPARGSAASRCCNIASLALLIAAFIAIETMIWVR
jgi:hypothetical protein